MKPILTTIILSFIELLSAQKLRHAMDFNMDKDSVYMRVISISKSILKTKPDTFTYDILQIRKNKTLEYRSQFDVSIYQINSHELSRYISNDSIIICINEKLNTRDTLMVELDKDWSCDQLSSINLHPLNNPYLSCFYPNNKLLLAGNLQTKNTVLFYKLININGFRERKIWFNKLNLTIDSLTFILGDDNFKVIFQYPDLVKFNYNQITLFDSDLKNSEKHSTPFNIKIIDSSVLNYLANQSIHKLYLIDFWFLGCEPCLRSFPKLQKINDQYLNHQLKIIALNSKDLETDITAFKKRSNYTFMMTQDSLKLTRYFKVNTFPTQILINNKGEVLGIFHGNSDENKDLIRIIEKYLNE